MYDEAFWEKIHKTGSDLDLLMQIPGLNDELAKFKDVVLEQTTRIGEKGLEAHAAREEEFRLVTQALEEVIAEAGVQSAIEAQLLHKEKDEAVDEAMSNPSPGSLLALEQLHDLMDAQKDAFMNREISVQFDCEEVRSLVVQYSSVFNL